MQIGNAGDLRLERRNCELGIRFGLRRIGIMETGKMLVCVGKNSESN